MIFLYNLGIKLYAFLIYIFHFFNKKAQLWVDGRRGLFSKIQTEVDRNQKHIWFHFASLGEFEQGRPVLEEIKKRHPQYPVIMTFFSPSGFELRKNFPMADHVYYLPIDSPGNAEKFVTLINPLVAIFTKYEYWYNYFHVLHQKKVPLYVISALFRPHQSFFKWYGSLSRKTLRLVSHFFVQDTKSVGLLKTIGLSNAKVSGDTRFDRVARNAEAPRQFAQVANFSKGSKTVVAGSTWPDDETLIAGLIRHYPSWKFIVAPHEIKPEKIKAFEEKLLPATFLRYSDIDACTLPDSGADESLSSETPSPINNPQVLIIDNIGMLSSLYQYGDIAYIGGGFGAGIHNTLEAAAFGIPVIFGPKYQNFLEAVTLIKKGAGFSISNEGELSNVFLKLQDEAVREQAGKAAEIFVSENKGATQTILDFLDKHIFSR